MLLQNINEEEGELYKSRFIPSKYLPRVKFSERIVTYVLHIATQDDNDILYTFSYMLWTTLNVDYSTKVIWQYAEFHKACSTDTLIVWLTFQSFCLTLSIHTTISVNTYLIIWQFHFIEKMLIVFFQSKPSPFWLVLNSVCLIFCMFRVLQEPEIERGIKVV